jgi:Right handed beta helix region/Protein of unknown function (DUF1565)
MHTTKHVARIFAAALGLGLLAALPIPFATRSSYAAAKVYYVGPAGSDANGGTADAPFKSIQKAIDLAQPGDTISLASGIYMQDVRSRRAGTAAAPITITGPSRAVIKGGGAAPIVEINHDFITLDGFTIDGLAGDPNSAAGYHDKLLYILGKAPHDGVEGLRVLRMTFRNAGGECLRLRYFAQRNEIAHSTFQGCGVHDFRFGAGGKNGEAIYIGTAPEQLGDGKNPTTDPDQSSTNWVHDNTFDTQGNECVDIKEAASANLVEHNSCTGQRDPESGGFDARGGGNVFRFNESYGNAGAGVRLGGDRATDGIGNDVYDNAIHDNRSGGIKVQQQPQGRLCGNTMSGNVGGDVVGSYRAQINPTAGCQTIPPATSTAVPIPTSAPPTPTGAPPATSTPAPAPSDCSRAYAVDGRANTFIEAEQYGSLSGHFRAQADSSRSAGAYMTIPASGMRKDVGTYLSYDLSVSDGGTFYIWLLGYGPDDSADSFFVQADGGSSIQANLTRGTWGWKRADGTIKLGSGAHTLQVKNREDGSSVDKFLLTKDKGFVPAGLGAAAQAVACR